MNIKKLRPPEDSKKEETKLDKFFYEIRKWWYLTFLRMSPFNEISGVYYNIKYGVTNLFRWFKIIWNDRNWDGSYIIDILIKKLEIQRDLLISDNNLDSDEIKIIDEDMSRCISLLKKANNDWDNYEKPFIDSHDKKWGNRDFDSVPIEGTENFEMVMKYSRDLTEEEKEQERNEYIEGIKRARDQRSKDLSEAMKIISDKVDSWWS